MIDGESYAQSSDTTGDTTGTGRAARRAGGSG